MFENQKFEYFERAIFERAILIPLLRLESRWRIRSPKYWGKLTAILQQHRMLLKLCLIKLRFWERTFKECILLCRYPPIIVRILLLLLFPSDIFTKKFDLNSKKKLQNKQMWSCFFKSFQQNSQPKHDFSDQVCLFLFFLKCFYIVICQSHSRLEIHFFL